MSSETAKILVIDDESSIRTSIIRTLRNEPYEIITASNGKEGLEILRQNPPDIVILDLMMPELSGIEFLQTINLKPDDPFAVIILTGHGDNAEMRQCYDLGAHFFIRKPFSITEFTCLVKRCLTLKKLEREAHLYQQYLEQSMKEQTAYISKLSMALDQSGSAVLMTDQNGTITYVNNAFIQSSGFTIADSHGQIPCYMDANKNPSTSKIIWEDLQSKGSWRGEIINTKKDGTKYWAYTAIFPVRDLSGEILNYLIIEDDITTIKEAQEAKNSALIQEAKTQKLRSDFSNNISHELLTPLHIISSSATLLESKGLTNEQKKYVSFIKQSASDLNNLIATLLQLKIEQGYKIPVRKQPFSLADILQDLTELYKKNIATKNIDIFFTLDKKLPSIVVGDEIRLRQILSYLLSNALKFTKKGHVSLSAHLFEEHDDDTMLSVAFEVADTGIGIPHDKIEHIFNPFLQGDSSSSREFGGLGIGLTLVQSLVNSLQGKIHVDSVVNSGSIFTVTLPLSKE